MLIPLLQHAISLMEMEMKSHWHKLEIHGDLENGMVTGVINQINGLQSLKSNWDGVMQMMVLFGWM